MISWIGPEWAREFELTSTCRETRFVDLSPAPPLARGRKFDQQKGRLL